MCSIIYLSLIGLGKHVLPEEYSAINAEVSTIRAPFTASVGTAQPTQEVDFRLLGLFPVRSSRLNVVTRDYVLVGGDIFGIKLYTRGVLVARTDVVETLDGRKNPAQQAGIKQGDIITHINGTQVNRKREVSALIEASGGTPLQLTIERSGEVLAISFQPHMCTNSERYTAGIWVRDSSAGIGTVTFYDKQTNTIAGLGHAITDVDSGEIIPIAGGELVRAKVMGVYKSADGTPGELCGVLEPQVIATLEANDETGVFGQLLEAPRGDLVPVALRNEVRTGPAQIIMTPSGQEPRTFDIEITRVAFHSESRQRNMNIRVTDPELIEITGGIVQGMSGSPIIQNGMIVGAVTHVFVNSPLEGYAIFAETMLATAREVSNNGENP